MSPTHTNPTCARVDEHRTIWAHAPYNFVPLPEKVVPARAPLSQDTYHDEGLTGWIECELETCSPTYVRGMMTEEQFWRLENKKPEEEISDKDKDEMAPFFSLPGANEEEGWPLPTIPGSSLRGMIRSLVEVAGYGHIRWVAKEPTITFRAVAAKRNDPLSAPYRNVIGSSNYPNVSAGYLEQKGNDWYVHPARSPRSMRWPEKGPCLKVNDSLAKNADIPGYIPLDDLVNYHPQHHMVSFDIKIKELETGPAVIVDKIGTREANHKYKGVMVCSGNMMESGEGEARKSNRKKHAVIMELDDKAKPLKIRPQSIQDYLRSLTLFQKEKLKNWGGEKLGCMRDGAPVFYVCEGNEVVCFGHCPNFRIPAELRCKGRAATPRDFVPHELQSFPEPDLADAIFGWTEEADEAISKHQAGRVFFTDARFVSAEDGIWLKTTPITLHTLSGPRPTTFQHYLVQDSKAGHNPDEKGSLAHYGSDPERTQIRGFKYYWHKGRHPDLEASSKEREHESQLTRIIPIKAGVHFSFRLYFENLRPEELGAVWWALSLPGTDDRTYRHKVGMGKPLGMGAAFITPKLHLSKRKERYEKLFEGEGWHEPVTPADAQPFLHAFETYVLEQNGIEAGANRLADLERIRMLLALLEWREGDPDWLEETRYMEINFETGREGEKVNEYKERPVLADPLAVVEKYTASKVHPSLQSRK